MRNNTKGVGLQSERGTFEPSVLSLPPPTPASAFTFDVVVASHFPEMLTHPLCPGNFQRFSSVLQLALHPQISVTHDSSSEFTTIFVVPPGSFFFYPSSRDFWDTHTLHFPFALYTMYNFRVLYHPPKIVSSY